jgi:hypothetical protein
MNTIVKKSASKAKIVKKSDKARRPTHFFLRILSRHPSTKDLRDKILIKGVKAVYRHGSTTDGKFEYELNSVDSVKQSADKLLMKQSFDKAEVKHSPWFHLGAEILTTKAKEWQEFLKKSGLGKNEDYIIIKQRWGSRGTGNYLIKNFADLDKFLRDKKANLSNYIAEEYKKYSVEYRIHATEYGYFYACRKVLKNDTPKDERFQRHDDNCSWLIETNPKFNKPENWVEIVIDCTKAVKALGADVLAFDVKCTSIKDSKDKKCKYIIIESCSAPSFGKITTEKYIAEIPKIINLKYGI